MQLEQCWVKRCPRSRTMGYELSRPRVGEVIVGVCDRHWDLHCDTRKSFHITDSACA